ncbi:hypothetical protein HDV00_000980 [Rhizophlyctis rosea]|nr:hypothetical protein HDV00_000980 [Rhizophlyctis rosea]
MLFVRRFQATKTKDTLAFLNAVSFYAAGQDVAALAVHLAPTPTLYAACNWDRDVLDARVHDVVTWIRKVHNIHQSKPVPKEQLPSLVEETIRKRLDVIKAKLGKDNTGRNKILNLPDISSEGHLGKKLEDPESFKKCWEDFRDGYAHVAGLTEFENATEDKLHLCCSAAHAIHSSSNYSPILTLYLEVAKRIEKTARWYGCLKVIVRSLTRRSIQKLGERAEVVVLECRLRSVRIRSWQLVAPSLGATPDQIKVLAQSQPSYPPPDRTGYATVTIRMHAELIIASEFRARHPKVNCPHIGVSKQCCYSCYQTPFMLRDHKFDVNVSGSPVKVYPRWASPGWLEADGGEVQMQLMTFWKSKLRRTRLRTSQVADQDSVYGHELAPDSEKTETGANDDLMADVWEAVFAGQRKESRRSGYEEK